MESIKLFNCKEKKKKKKKRGMSTLTIKTWKFVNFLTEVFGPFSSRAFIDAFGQCFICPWKQRLNKQLSWIIRYNRSLGITESFYRVTSDLLIYMSFKWNEFIEGKKK